MAVLHLRSLFWAAPEVIFLSSLKPPSGRVGGSNYCGQPALTLPCDWPTEMEQKKKPVSDTVLTIDHLYKTAAGTRKLKLLIPFLFKHFTLLDIIDT